MQYKKEYFQHQDDLDSLLNIRGISWLSALSKKVMSAELEQDFYMLNLMDNIMMAENDFPQLHQWLDHCCEKLAIQNKPVLFLDTRADPHVIAIGEENPMLIISNTMIELLDETELKAVIAHELGHLACGHSFYKLIVENFSGITQTMSAIPGMSAIGLAAKLPLYDWFRKADLSADRAATLLMESSEPVINMIAKLAGGSKQMASQVSLENLYRQSDEIEQLNDELKKGGTMDKISYLFSSTVMNGIMRQSPWPAKRIQEIRQWSSSDAYLNLQKGETPDIPTPNESETEPPADDTGTFDKISDGISNLKFWK